MYLEKNLEKINEKYAPFGLHFVLEEDIIRIFADDDTILAGNAKLRDELKFTLKELYNPSRKSWYIGDEGITRLQGRSLKFHPTKDVEELKRLLLEYVDLIEESDLKTSLFAFLEKTPYFFEAPAAKSMHHNYRYGLLEHTVQTVQMARLVAKNMAQDIEVPLDYDLLLAGAILHDCGKIDDYVIKGDTITTTDIHQKQDHIIHGVKIITQEIRTEKLDELLHIIASHHAIREWGSPVEPKTPEAWIIHTVENLSSKIMG